MRAQAFQNITFKFYTKEVQPSTEKDLHYLRKNCYLIAAPDIDHSSNVWKVVLLRNSSSSQHGSFRIAQDIKTPH
jgi:hypothetical protein